MNRSWPISWLLAGLLVCLPLLSGCPLKWEEEQTDNTAPFTYFPRTPPDTSFTNTVSYEWTGTDVDSDVVAYRYQLVETDSLFFATAGDSGAVLRSIVPRAETSAVLWTERQTDNFESFANLPDGWYEFRAVSIDDEGAESPSARHRFYLFFDDVSPTTTIDNDPRCPRLNGQQSYVFLINATDESRSGVVRRSDLEFSVQLRATSIDACSQHVADAFTEWQKFPDDSTAPVPIGGDGNLTRTTPPTVYNDLFPPGCSWEFKVKVRDPAGNIDEASCIIEQPN